MSTTHIIFGIIVTCILAVLFLRHTLRENAKRADQGRMLFEAIITLFNAPEVLRGSTVGVWTLTGHYRDQHFQLKSVADTLATRKLPSLWLMVTLPEPHLVSATTDIMMRAAGISSFSNFDFLPHTLTKPTGFPEQATIRSDVDENSAIVSLIAPHIDIFMQRRGKEILISPKGLRAVVQLAEADRARYGVFREANFAGATIDVQLARDLMGTLITIQQVILEHAKT